jgi:hypothetical protein
LGFFVSGVDKSARVTARVTVRVTVVIKKALLITDPPPERA